MKNDFEKRNELIGFVRHEYTLINNRILWLIYTQSIFLGAYAVVLTNSSKITNYANLIHLLTTVGLTSCIAITLSIIAAIWATRNFMKDAGDNSMIGRKATYFLGLTADLALPIIFIDTWTFIIYESVRLSLILIFLFIISIVWILYFSELNQKD